MEFKTQQIEIGVSVFLYINLVWSNPIVAGIINMEDGKPE